MKHLVIVGLNCAWQKTLIFQDFRKGKVNRALQLKTYGSGKGGNCCRASLCYGLESPLLITSAGGENGRRMLEDFQQNGIAVKAVQTTAETRCCITCLDNTGSEMTELIEPSAPLSENDCRQVLNILDTALENAGAIAICGSLPDKTKPGIYLDIVDRANQNNIPVVADTLVDAAQILQKKNCFLKVNREEIVKICGCDSLQAALEKVRAMGAAAVVTDGASAGYLVFDGSIYSAAIPPIEHVASTLGCGDTATAVFSAGLMQAFSSNGSLSTSAVQEAFLCSLAAASANCLNDQAGCFSLRDFQELRSKIKLAAFTA